MPASAAAAAFGEGGRRMEGSAGATGGVAGAFAFVSWAPFRLSLGGLWLRPRFRLKWYRGGSHLVLALVSLKNVYFIIVGLGTYVNRFSYLLGGVHI